MNDVSLDELVALYAGVFAGEPWYEIERCAACGKSYPGPKEARKESSFVDGQVCWNTAPPHNEHTLRLVSYYLDPGDPKAQAIVSNAFDHSGFIGFVAREGGRLIGFSWGYAVPQESTPSTNFVEVCRLLRDESIDPDRTFYAAETGVVEEQQGKGVGEAVLRKRLEAAAEEGFELAVFRTVDRKRLLRLWEKVVGATAIRELFRDPDPAKSQVWFSADLSRLVDQ